MSNLSLNSSAEDNQIESEVGAKPFDNSLDRPKQEALFQASLSPQSSSMKLENLPPMLRLYVEYKSKHSECVIFFQVGDFYEVFFEDAVSVAKALNLTLTSRDKTSESPIPMCGIPVSALDGYLERLVDLGHSVAVVSQVNTSSLTRLPAAFKEEQGPSKINITRALTRIVTPGIRLLSEGSSSTEPSIVMALIFGAEQRATLSYSDPQSGVIYVRASLNEDELSEEIARVSPLEIVLPRMQDGSRLDGRSGLVRKIQKVCPRAILKYRDPQNLRLNDTATRSFNSLEGFRSLESSSKRAVQMLLDYIDQTTLGALLGFTKVVVDEGDDVMLIGATTRFNLELFSSPTAGYQGSVLNAIDRTVSSGGGRLLRSWLTRPSRSLALIKNRHDCVAFFLSQEAWRRSMRSQLKLVPDLERIVARIELQCASPRELGALRDTLNLLKAGLFLPSELMETMPAEANDHLLLLRQLVRDTLLADELVDLLNSALLEEIPQQISDGPVMRDSYHAELDALRALQRQGRSWVAAFEREQQTRSGIPSLKVRFNYVLGFFIEVTKSHLSKVPADFEKRQSTTNSARFVTAELKERERSVLGVDEKALALEKKLFSELRSSLQRWTEPLRTCAKAVAQLDVLASFADLAEHGSYVRPEVNESLDFVIEKGRHPVVEQLNPQGFVPNSVRLKGGSAEQAVDLPCALILTGPNMGGKSTFLRQAAILTIMAQMGSFVPAQRFHFGIVDQIFARIGASDNTAGGESTFMVEMREVVQIVTASSERSLLLIDEVGRGTATGDGAALAQAVIEWLVKERCCRILFATHFHALTQLPDSNPRMQNICVGAVRNEDEIIFTHQIKEGAANHSYGLDVAKLAGVPAEIISRSSELVERNVRAESSASRAVPKATNQLPLPIAKVAEVPAEYETLCELRLDLKAIDINSLTPLEALGKLAKLQEKLQ